MNQNNEQDIVWIFNVLWRHKWLIIGLILLSLIVSLVVVNSLPPIYKASATIMIERPESGSISELNTLMAGERLALTYSQIITSQPILERVADKLDLSIPIDELKKMITVQPIADTQLVNITVENSSPYRVFMIANAIAETFIDYVESIEAENYAQALKDVELRIDQKQDEIDSILPEIDRQNQTKADLQAEITRLESLLSANRVNYQILQQNAQALDLTIAHLVNKIRVVEPAHIDNPATSQSYTASLMMFFEQDIISGSTNYSGRISDLILQVYGPMLERQSLLNEIIGQLDLTTSPAILATHISYNAVPNTQFLELSVSDADATKAIQILEMLTAVFIDQNLSSLSEPYTVRLVSIETELSELTDEMAHIQIEVNRNNSLIIPINLELEQLERELSTRYSDLRELQSSRDQYILEANRSANAIVIVEPATQPYRQTENRTLYVALAIFTVIMASVGLAFVLEHFDSKLRTQEDLTDINGLKPLSVIGRIEKGKEKLILGPDSSPQVSEDFRKLSAIIHQAIEDVPVRKLLVTSPGPGEGKTTVAANLAIALAKTGTQVVLVDADLHRPQLEKLFHLQAQQGLAEVLANDGQIPPLQATELLKLKVLTSGAPTLDASELLSSPKLANLLDTLAVDTNLVMIDCPPVLALADASYLTPLVDGVILVTRSGNTDKKAAVEALALLKMAKIQYISIVLNEVAYRPNYYHHYYDQIYRKTFEQHKTP